MSLLDEEKIILERVDTNSRVQSIFGEDGEAYTKWTVVFPGRFNDKYEKYLLHDQNLLIQGSYTYIQKHAKTLKDWGIHLNSIMFPGRLTYEKEELRGEDMCENINTIQFYCNSSKVKDININLGSQVSGRDDILKNRFHLKDEFNLVNEYATFSGQDMEFDGNININFSGNRYYNNIYFNSPNIPKGLQNIHGNAQALFFYSSDFFHKKENFDVFKKLFDHTKPLTTYGWKKYNNLNLRTTHVNDYKTQDSFFKALLNRFSSSKYLIREDFCSINSEFKLSDVIDLSSLRDVKSVRFGNDYFNITFTKQKAYDDFVTADGWKIKFSRKK